MQTHLVSTFIGVLLAIGLVAWIQPNTGGTTFIVVVTLLAVNAVGALAHRR